MVDHDQRFKEMLREFVWELLALSLPSLAGRLTGQLEWQSQEVFTNPPLGLVRRVDLLAQVVERIDERTAERLLHLEVESAGSLGEVRKKIGYYYPALRTKHNLPVTTLAVYLKVGQAGEGWDAYQEEDVGEGEPESRYRVRWRYVGLPALPAERYLASSNWLGVALSALMRIEDEPQALAAGRDPARLALECKENDYRKLLLINCVDTYLPMEGEQLDVFERLVSQDARYQEAKAMIQTTYDRGVRDGERKGEAKGEPRSPASCGDPPGNPALWRTRRVHARRRSPRSRTSRGWKPSSRLPRRRSRGTNSWRASRERVVCSGRQNCADRLAAQRHRLRPAEAVVNLRLRVDAQALVDRRADVGRATGWSFTKAAWRRRRRRPCRRGCRPRPAPPNSSRSSGRGRRRC